VVDGAQILTKLDKLWVGAYAFSLKAMKRPQSSFRSDRLGYLAAAALFVAFLAYSAPHQVHHVFDHSHSTTPPCQAFAIAKGCHLQVAAAGFFSFELTIGEWIAPIVDASTPRFAHSSVSQRAPPLV